MILGPESADRSGRTPHAAGWRWHLHHCTAREARRLPVDRYPDARHVTIVGLWDFLRMMERIPGADEQRRVAALDEACRSRLGHGARPGQCHFRDRPAPERAPLELIRRRDDAPGGHAGGRKAA